MGDMVVCTKLVQWLTVVGVFGAVWCALVGRLLPVQLSDELYDVVLPVSTHAVHTSHMYKHIHTHTQ